MTTLHHRSHHPHHASRCRTFYCPLHPASTPSAAVCASCLRDRLSVIEPSSLHEIPNTSAPRADDLRRCKSYSASRNFPCASAEPRRRSCDSRSRSRSSTLSDLFTEADEAPRRGLKVESLSGLREVDEDDEQEGGEIRVIRDDARPDNAAAYHRRRFYDDKDDEFGDDVELKTMKEFIDLELHSKKLPRREMSSFWEVASVFGKRLTNWRRKPRKKGGGDTNAMKAGEKLDPNKIKLRVTEMQSEVGEYGLGRRSCDTDPRFSLDAGRLSLDTGRLSLDGGRIPVDLGRFSVEEPRASWDGYMIGGRSHHHHHQQRFNPMVSFLEDVKVIDSMLKNRALVEEKLSVVDEEGRSPGGSNQTRDYYKDSAGSQRRRRSFDRSSSQRKGCSLEADDLRSMSNAKVSPATTELFYGAKLLISEGKLRASESKVSGDDGFLKCAPSASGNVGYSADGTDPGQIKKLQKWSKGRSFWGIIQKRNESKCADEAKSEDKCLEPLAIPDSWQRENRVPNGGEVNGMISSKLVRSGSVSARNSGASAVEARGISTRAQEECVLHRNQNVKYSSPGNIENGLLRFYLTPLRSNKSMKSRLRKAHSVTRGSSLV